MLALFSVWSLRLFVAGLPYFNGFPFASPFEGFAVGGKVEVDVLAFNSAPNIFDAPPAIAGNLHDSSKGIVAGVGGNGAPVGFGAGGGDAYGLRFSFVGAGGEYGLEFPVAFPTATFATTAIAGGLHVNDLWFLATGNLIFFPARYAPVQHHH